MWTLNCFPGNETKNIFQVVKRLSHSDFATLQKRRYVAGAQVNFTLTHVAKSSYDIFQFRA